MRRGEEIWLEVSAKHSADNGFAAVINAVVEQAQREALEEAARLCDESARRHARSLQGKLTRQQEVAACCFQGAYEASAEAIRNLIPIGEGE